MQTKTLFKKQCDSSVKTNVVKNGVARDLWTN